MNNLKLKLVIGIILLFSENFYAQPGSLDKSFGMNGIMTTSLGNWYSAIKAIALQSDSKIIASGYTYNGTRLKFSLVRYDTNGYIDPTFGNNGIVISSIDSAESAIDAMVIQKDDKIIVAGNAGDSIGNDNYDNFIIVRYNKDGMLDTSFGLHGKCETSFGAYSIISALAQQNDGKIVAAGLEGFIFSPAGNKIAMARYDTRGKLDTSFGDHGLVVTSLRNIDDGANSVSICNDRKILVGGRSYHNRTNSMVSDFALVRYNQDGTLDTTFGISGNVISEIGIASNITKINITKDNKIIASGYAYNGSDFDFALARYNPGGTLDRGFGVNGITTTSIGSGDDFLRCSVIQPDNKIIAIGNSFANSVSRFALARYQENGSLDSSFGDNGILVTEYDSLSCVLLSVLLQPDLKILTAGQAHINDSVKVFAIARFISGLNLGVINPLVQRSTFFIYPNPVHQKVNLEYILTESASITIILYDASNKLINTYSDNVFQSLGSHTQTIDLPNSISAGSYFLRIVSQKFSFVCKLLKY